MKALITFLLIGLCTALPANAANILLGVDVLINSDFLPIKDKKVCLLTNQSGRTSTGKLTAEVFAKSKDIKLVSIFVPEHGLFGADHAGAKVENETFMDIPVFSLYGNARNPHPKEIAKTDVVVVDLQDIGVRSYTFLSTMLYVIKAAAEQNKPVFILDRPNPIGGNIVDGNVLEEGRESFVGIVPVPYLHGMTFGELALMISDKGWLGTKKNGDTIRANINVITMKYWERNMPFEETGLAWFPTSPHIPSVDAIRGAAVLGIFGELGIINIGIGTTLPFQYIGSPTFKVDEILAELCNGQDFDGLNLYKARYKPYYAKYSNEFCEGILLKFPKSDNFLPYQSGATIFFTIKKNHPELFNPNKISKNARDMFIKVTGTEQYFNLLFGNSSAENYFEIVRKGVEEFKQAREKYLLY